MRKSTYITLKDLGKMMHIHTNTLNAWICHYSLAKYVSEKILWNSKAQKIFKLTKTSISQLGKYMAKKGGKYERSYERNKEKLEKML